MALAIELNVSQQVLASAAVRDLLSRPSADFEAAASNVLANNEELYRRLA